jgi:hypothetical protein
MPSDAVWIDNFRFLGNPNQKILEIKNLIGRAGRSNANKNSFDYGYVIVPLANYNTFLTRISSETRIKNSSEVDIEDITSIPEDMLDIVSIS